MAAPADKTITPNDLATRLDALSAEVNTLTDAADQLGFDSDPGVRIGLPGLAQELAPVSA